jgi:AAA15 family ATPase/GTPase
MIESVQFKNFKALRDTTLPLDRFTLIVGPNGSGKSTALQAVNIAIEPARLSSNQVISAGLNQLAPSQLKQQRLKEEALRLAQDLDKLEKFFPIGFGLLARSVRRW